MTSFIPKPKSKPISRSGAQLTHYHDMQRGGVLIRNQLMWADIIRSYIVYRLNELRLDNENTSQAAAQLYLGYRDWGVVRNEICDFLPSSHAGIDKLPAGAVGFIYSCPVFLVNAEYHLMLCEVPA